MTEVGIRALKQNASAVVAAASRGDVITITDRGRAVAQMSSLPESPFERLAAAGLIRQARRRLSDLPAPEPGHPLSATLADDRDESRY